MVTGLGFGVTDLASCFWVFLADMSACHSDHSANLVELVGSGLTMVRQNQL